MSTYEKNRTESAHTEPSTVNMSTTGSSKGWEAYKPKSVAYADTLDKARVDEIWKAMYKRAGVSTEEAYKEVRAAVYVYCALNGTSRAGSYEGRLTTSSGSSFDAAELPRLAGMNIRKFMRSNMDESYAFFKESRVMEDYSRFVARAADLGVSPSEAFATADWLADCSLFTPNEKRAHDNAFRYAVQRSRGARDGKSLEQVETDGLQSRLQAQGSDTNNGTVEW